MDATLAPRFRALQRGAIRIGVMLAIVLVVRAWWGYSTAKLVQSEVAAAHARGEPILPEDFDPREAVPDSDNAALTYQQAAASIRLTANQITWRDSLSSSNSFTSADLQMMRQILLANQGVAPLLHRARDQQRADWGVRLSRPVMFTRLPQLNPTRQLSSFLKWSARAEHEQGDDGDAVETLCDAERLGDAFIGHASLLITHLVGLGVVETASRTVLDVAPTLRVRVDGGTPNLSGSGKEATAWQIRSLISQLLDERGIRDGAELALRGEAMGILDAASNLGKMPSGIGAPYIPRPIEWVFHPMFTRDGIRASRLLQCQAAAAKATSYPELLALSRKGIPATPVGGESPVEVPARVVSAMLVPSTYRWSLTQFHALTNRRAAALVLALRLYERDHEDRLPTSLQDLVPVYLPHLPADPMRADGKPFGYLPQAKPPAIYSVADDGRDDGGSSRVAPNAFSSQPQWKTADSVYPYDSTKAQ